MCFFFFSSRRRHTRFKCDWSSDVCSSDLVGVIVGAGSCDRDPRAHDAGKGGGCCRATTTAIVTAAGSEERRVGKKGRSRGAPYHLKKKKKRRGKSDGVALKQNKSI